MGTQRLRSLYEEDESVHLFLFKHALSMKSNCYRCLMDFRFAMGPGVISGFAKQLLSELPVVGNRGYA